MQDKIDDWLQQLGILSKLAKTAYTSFITGFKSKVSYYMRTIPDIAEQLKQIDELVQTEFIPAITVGIVCSEFECHLSFLPPKMGGLGIPIFET